MASARTIKDDASMKLDDIFTRIADLIDGADASGMPSYEITVPHYEWRQVEADLLRSPAMRKRMPSAFVWRGVVVAHGDGWGVVAV